MKRVIKNILRTDLDNVIIQFNLVKEPGRNVRFDVFVPQKYIGNADVNIETIRNFFEKCIDYIDMVTTQKVAWSLMLTHTDIVLDYKNINKEEEI